MDLAGWTAAASEENRHLGLAKLIPLSRLAAGYPKRSVAEQPLVLAERQTAEPPAESAEQDRKAA